MVRRPESSLHTLMKLEHTKAGKCHSLPIGRTNIRDDAGLTHMADSGWPNKYKPDG